MIARPSRLCKATFGAVLLGIFILFYSSPALAGGVSFTLAAAGQPTPDGGDIIDSPGAFALSDSGAVYTAYLQNAKVTAVFGTTLAGKVEIARPGDILAGNYTITNVVGELWTNNRAQAMLYATLADGQNALQSSLLVGDSFSDLRIAVASGETMPDGGLFTWVSPGALDDLGDVVFDGKGGGETGVFVANHNGTISKIALVGDLAPGESYPFDFVANEGISDNGQVVFGATIHDTHAGTGNNSATYVATSANDIVRVARSYDAVPGTPYFLGQDGARDVNRSGTTLLSGSLIDALGVTRASGIFTAGVDSGLKVIAYTGQAAPGGLGNYTTFDSINRFDDVGTVAFTGYINVAVSSGVFLGDGSTQKVIALAGQAAPGGGTFTGFATALMCT